MTLTLTLTGGAILFRASSGAAGSDLLTATIIRRDIEQAILASGILEPIQMVNVGAQDPGQVTRLYVHLGQQVKAGDPIGEVDAVQQESALKLG